MQVIRRGAANLVDVSQLETHRHGRGMGTPVVYVIVMRVISTGLAAFVGGFAGLATGGLLVNAIGPGPIAVLLVVTLSASGALFGARLAWAQAPQARLVTR